MEIIGTILSSQRSRPLSIAVAVLTLFVPSSLIIFLARPDLYTTLGTDGVLLLSTGISLPIVVTCYGIWYTALSTLVTLQESLQGQAPDPPPDIHASLSRDDKLEWPCLIAGSWVAMNLLFVLAVVAYYRPFRLGATFFLVEAILLAIWILVFLVAALATIWLKKKLRDHQRTLEETARF